MKNNHRKNKIIISSQMSRRIINSERYWRNSLRQPTSLPTNVETTEVASLEKCVEFQKNYNCNGFEFQNSLLFYSDTTAEITSMHPRQSEVFLQILQFLSDLNQT